MENIISEISSLWKTIKDVYKGISSFRLIMLSVLVGILAGLAAALFFFLELNGLNLNSFTTLQASLSLGQVVKKFLKAILENLDPG